MIKGYLNEKKACVTVNCVWTGEYKCPVQNQVRLFFGNGFTVLDIRFYCKIWNYTN